MSICFPRVIKPLFVTLVGFVARAPFFSQHGRPHGASKESGSGADGPEDAAKQAGVLPTSIPPSAAGRRNWHATPLFSGKRRVVHILCQSAELCAESMGRTDWFATVVRCRREQGFSESSAAKRGRWFVCQTEQRFVLHDRRSEAPAMLALFRHAWVARAEPAVLSLPSRRTQDQ